MDSTTSDPYLKFTFCDSKKVKTKSIDRTINPIWNEKIEKQIDSNLAEASFVDMKVMDKDGIMRGGNDLMGSQTLNIMEALKTPGKWLFDQKVKLDPPPGYESKDAGEVYIQVRYLPKGTIDNQFIPKPKYTLPPQDQTGGGGGEVQPQEPPATNVNNDVMKGQLKVVVKLGRNIKNQDWGGKSDPFVRIKLPDGQKAETKVIDNNLNPEWNESFSFEVDLGDAPGTCSFEVRDQDNMSSESCGLVKVDLGELLGFGAANTWKVNRTFDIELKGKKAGLLYLQMRFVPEGAVDDGEMPEDINVP